MKPACLAKRPGRVAVDPSEATACRIHASGTKRALALAGKNVAKKQ